MASAMAVRAEAWSRGLPTLGLRGMKRSTPSATFGLNKGLTRPLMGAGTEAGRPGSLPLGNRTTGCASGLNASDRLAGPLLDGLGPGPNVSRDDKSRVSELRRARFSFAAMAFSRAAWIPLFDRSPKLVRREATLDAAEAVRVRSSCDLRLFDR